MAIFNSCVEWPEGIFTVVWFENRLSWKLLGPIFPSHFEVVIIVYDFLGILHFQKHPYVLPAKRWIISKKLSIHFHQDEDPIAHLGFQQVGDWPKR